MKSILFVAVAFMALCVVLAVPGPRPGGWGPGDWHGAGVGGGWGAGGGWNGAGAGWGAGHGGWNGAGVGGWQGGWKKWSDSEKKFNNGVTRLYYPKSFSTNIHLSAWGAMGRGGTAEGGLRRRMPLRRAGGGSATRGGHGLGGRAMRYYRLWIYTCNTALLAGAVAFTGAAVKTILFDFRRSLVPSLTLYQPSFLYAYLALATQGGALQLLGCLAALKLSEKLLNAYWLLLLVLVFGDVVIGAFWAYRFERICQELRPALRLRFQQEYGTNSAMTSLWDRLQAEDQCCGVSGPEEFSNTTGTVRWEMPASCCFEPAASNVTRCAKVRGSFHFSLPWKEFFG
ncbi:hypothetical protein HUJ05_003344 [Dendroctonus ponderosae]|nr:hypothetical protein HUJ05_003344 [Dendroctonus ponderosae]